MVPAYAASAQPGDAILGVQDSSGIPLPAQREKGGWDKGSGPSRLAEPLRAAPRSIPSRRRPPRRHSRREGQQQGGRLLSSLTSEPARRQGLAPGAPRGRGDSRGAVTPPGWPRRDRAAQTRKMAAGPGGTRNYDSRHAPRLALAQDAPRGDPRSLAPARCDAAELRRTPQPGRPRARSRAGPGFPAPFGPLGARLRAPLPAEPPGGPLTLLLYAAAAGRAGG